MEYDVKEVAGTRNHIYRTRIGGYRIAFAVTREDDKITVGVVGADKRDGVYGNTDTFDERTDDF